MTMALQQRVSALEAEVRNLREVVADLSVSEPKVNPNGPRRMCQHCGVVPNYYLHTKNCKGPWQGAQKL